MPARNTMICAAARKKGGVNREFDIWQAANGADGCDMMVPVCGNWLTLPGDKIYLGAMLLRVQKISV